MISYITPTLWERTEFILEAEKSLANQTYKDIEWIIVSNKSQTIQLHGGVNTKIIIDENLKNVAQKRNLGIQRSSGDLLAFLDDDDIKYPTFGEEMKNAINPSYIGSVSSMITINEKSEIIGNHLYCPNTFDNVWNSACLYFANEILICKYIAIEMDTSEDYEFFARLFKRGELHNLVDRFLSGYRKHPGNLSGNEEIRGEPTHKSIHYMFEKHGIGFYCNRCNKDTRK
jgi:glycosyltransferase involved in cell wall biosynthesis